MKISDESFRKFKELMRKHIGDEEYEKKTEQELYESAQKLLQLVKIVESEANS